MATVKRQLKEKVGGGYDVIHLETSAEQVIQDSTRRFLTDAERITWNGKEDASNKKTTLTDNSDTYYPTQKAVKTAVDAKQDTLVSGTNIKTINGDSILGSGDLVVSGGSTYDDTALWAELIAMRYENPIDEPAEISSSWDDEFDDSFLNEEKWSWVNQGSATAELTNGNLYLDMLSGGDHSRLIVQEAPTGDFVCTSKLTIQSQIVSYLRAGLVLYNSANGNRIIFGYRINQPYYGTEPSVGGVKCQNNSWTADLPTQLIKEPYIYARITLESGTLTFDWSADGVKWITLTSETVSNYLGAISHIGLGAFRNNTDGKTYYAKFDWFRVTE